MNALTESLGADIGPLAAGISEGRERRAKLAAAMAAEKARIAQPAEAGISPNDLSQNFSQEEWFPK
jgi:hypothetical protein